MATLATPLTITTLAPDHSAQGVTKTGPLFLRQGQSADVHVRLSKDNIPEFSTDLINWFSPTFGGIAIVWLSPPGEKQIDITYHLVPSGKSGDELPILGPSDHPPSLSFSPVDPTHKTQTGTVPAADASIIYHFKVNELDPGFMITPG